MYSATGVVVSILLTVAFCTLCFSDDKFTPMVEASKCMGKTVCGIDEVLNYPSEHIQQLLKQVPLHFEHHLADDEDVHREPPKKFSNLLRRRRDVRDAESDSDEEKGYLCKSAKKVVSMAVAMNKDNEWRFIVKLSNVTENYLVEVCLLPGSTCTIHTNVIENSTCRQKYIYRQLLSVNRTGGIESDDFKLPSVCTCYYNKPQIQNIL